MNRLNVAAQQIKDSISALDVGNALGLEIRRGRCQCPFHGGKDFNCVLYAGQRGWYCHVCKRGGDIISFAKEYNGTSFRDTVAWFNDTFHMGMDIESPMSPDAVKQAEKARIARERERDTREWQARMRYGMALTADDMVRKMEDMRDAHRPKTYGAWDSEFCEAVRLLPEAREFAEECWMECTEAKKE